MLKRPCGQGPWGASQATLVHEVMEKRDEKVRQTTLFNLDKFGGIGPSPPPEGTDGSMEQTTARDEIRRVFEIDLQDNQK